MWFTVGPRGTRTTVGLPGTGLSYTETSPAYRAHPATSKFGTPSPEEIGSPPLGPYGIPLASRSIWPTPLRTLICGVLLELAIAVFVYSRL